MLRLDPLTEAGDFDIEFFAQEDYPSYRDIAERYLKNEGFDIISEPIGIQIADRWWNVWSTANKEL